MTLLNPLQEDVTQRPARHVTPVHQATASHMAKPKVKRAGRPAPSTGGKGGGLWAEWGHGRRSSPGLAIQPERSPEPGAAWLGTLPRPPPPGLSAQTG